ncbi:hypothetical protein [Rhodopirellula bahusiensis]|uniref:Uncharacterized protein n=1 Tax=Rhodopirellula bahusiensis TaxID=2014065 RepID=A0A2G1WDP5_9BACT|nr:hypothetical protein [Rhodopirellula bahusiensis]PHQ37174.1 hypothetical protein CEE69_02145 [Rhodopirellula bahusiensis]
MAKSEQQKQKKLAKLKAKEQRKKKELARQQQMMASMAGKMRAAATGSIVDCMISPELLVQKPASPAIGHVMLSRTAPGGQIAAAFFLIDLGCMGVKDATGNYRTQTEYNDVIADMRSRQMVQPCPPEFARGVVEAAIAYAESCGLQPHPDYNKFAPLWHHIEPASVGEAISFGFEGKPTYVAGPFDDMARQTRIYNRMLDTLGEGNFDFAMATLGAQNFDDFELDEEIELDEESSIVRLDSAE